MLSVASLSTVVRWTGLWLLILIQESNDNALLNDIQSGWTMFTTNFRSKYHAVDFLNVATNGRILRELGRDGQHNFFSKSEYIEGALNGRMYFHGFSNDYAFVLEARTKSDWDLIALALGNSQSNVNLKNDLQDYSSSQRMRRKFDSGMIFVAQGIPLDVLALHDPRWGVKVDSGNVFDKPNVKIVFEPKLSDFECPETGVIFPASKIKSGELVLDSGKNYLPVSGRFRLERSIPNHLVWEERFSWAYQQASDGTIQLTRFVVQEYFCKPDGTMPDQPNYEYQGLDFHYHPTVDPAKFLVSTYGFAEPKIETRDTSWFVPVILIFGILLGAFGIYLKSRRN